jgi:hypothetical protein
MKKIVDGVIDNEMGALQYEMFEDQKTHEICFVEKYNIRVLFPARQFLATDVAQICRQRFSEAARKHGLLQRVYRSSCEGRPAVERL